MITKTSAKPTPATPPMAASPEVEFEPAESEGTSGPSDASSAAAAHHESLTVVEVDCQDVPGFDGHERVVYGTEPASGLRAFVAIHSTRLGPALGGCRRWHYASQSEALQDVLRLSQGMSYKHAVAGTGQGGGKAVLLADGAARTSPRLFEAFGRLVQRLGGLYVTAEDVGTSVDDMVAVRRQTPHVAGLPEALGGSGDPSPVTAYGVYCGIQACLAHRRGLAYDPHRGLEGVTVAVQGTGHVGHSLCGFLHRAGARLVIADVNEAHLRQVLDDAPATVVAPEEIHRVPADVFAPCALGGVLQPRTVDALAAPIVAGAANNQLARPEVGEQLWRRGVLYAPDYVINAGGIINISYEQQGYARQPALLHTERIGVTLCEIFAQSEATHTPPHLVADARALLALRQPT